MWPKQKTLRLSLRTSNVQFFFSTPCTYSQTALPSYMRTVSERTFKESVINNKATKSSTVRIGRSRLVSSEVTEKSSSEKVNGNTTNSERIRRSYSDTGTTDITKIRAEIKAMKLASKSENSTPISSATSSERNSSTDEEEDKEQQSPSSPSYSRQVTQYSRQSTQDSNQQEGPSIEPKKGASLLHYNPTVTQISTSTKRRGGTHLFAVPPVNNS